jgi:two-component system, NarL family, sensor kinase
LDGAAIRNRVSVKLGLDARAPVTARSPVLLLAIACVAAAVCFATILLLGQAAHDRTAIEQEAEAIARASAAAVDMEVGAAQALLTGLTVSDALGRGDLELFHDQAVKVPKPPGSWIVLFDPEGRQLVTTLRPYGAALPPMSEAAKRVISAIVESRQGSVTDLHYSPLIDRYAVGAGVPVMRDGAVAYVLSLANTSESWTRVLDQRIPAGWTTAVLDRLGAPIAFYAGGGRTLEHPDPVTPHFEQLMSERGSAFIAQSRSNISGWTAMVAVPHDVIAAPMRRASLLVGGGAGILLVAAVGMALVAGGRIDRPFRARIEASDERFHVMADTVPCILFCCAPSGECEFVNQRFYDFTGMAAGTALRFGWNAALHPGDERRILRSLKDPGDLLLNEVRLRAKDGEYRWFLARSRPVRDAGGRIVRWFGSAIDIDDLRKSDAVLRRTNERLRAVLAGIDEAYFTVDRQWRITYVNPKAAVYYGQEPERLVGRSLWEVAPQLVGTEVETRLREVLDRRRPLRMERLSLTYPDRWFHVACYPWAEGLSIFFTDITERKTAELAVRRTQELLQLTMDALPAQIAILDEGGVVIAVNAAWRRFAEETGVREAACGVGADYAAICEATIPDALEAERAAKALQALLRAERQEFRIDYGRPGLQGLRWFQMRTIGFGDDGARRMVIEQEDITDIKRAEAGLRELAERLLRLQDEERRHMARELHDTTAQNLVAVLLDIDRLTSRLALDDASGELIDEMRKLIEQSLQEIRTLSYLLHPPLLDELGLPSALRWFVRGFENRSGITVALSIQEEMERLPLDVENALFRVVQEALTNIHRHSESATAEIRLARSAQDVVLEIADHGRGISADAGSDSDIAALGLGISGMRVRLHQLGGELEIRSAGQGTTVCATVSVDRLRSNSAADTTAPGATLRPAVRPL